MIRPRLRPIYAAIAAIILIATFQVVSRGAVAPSITSLSPTSGPVGTPVTITGANFVTDLLVGKIGWWGPFQSGVVPRNLIIGNPNGAFIGTPTFTGDGGGAFTSSATNYLDISDGGTGGTYDWTSGAWSAQVDFMFPATPVFAGGGILTLVSKGSFGQGNGWEMQINDSLFQGRYQLQFLTNHGIDSYSIISEYQVVPGAFHRALIVCSGGTGTWYINGVAGNPQACTPPTSGSTHLLVGRYTDAPGYPAGFPISRVQIWNRALTAAEATLTTTTDPIPNTVTFNGTAATPTSWTATSIVAPVPVGAAAGPVVVSVAGQASNGVAFTVGAGGTSVPAITTLSPTTGAVGAAVTIAGSNFGATQGTSTVTFNGTTATPTSWSATSIAVPVPSGATSGPVVVTVGGQASNGVAFTVTPPPSITTLAPTAGAVGTVVTITGTTFGATQGTSTVRFNGTTATPTSWSATSIVVPVPTGATTGNVVVTVSGQASNGVAFTVAPSITTLAPSAGVVGTAVTVTGLNFGTTQGTSTVTFNGTTATPTTWSATSIAVPVPVGATSGNVVVTVGGRASNGVAFSVTPPPSITTLTPTAGAVGTEVTITGATFGATQGTSTVRFNGTTATPTSWSATSIVVPVPTGATTGNVVVTVGGQASNGVAFTVAPSITTLAPTAGGVGSVVTITGLNFGATQGPSTVTFNGTTATPTTWSATSIAVPVPVGATTGAVVVTVGGQASNGVAFTVTVPPNITIVAPASGAVGTVVTITGTTFGATQGTSTVRFNGTTATPTSWSATSIVVPVPSGATTGDVVVTVSGQASNGVAFTVAPSITTLAPTAGAVGVVVIITGLNFGATQGPSTVTFNGTTATPTTWSATSIAVPVPVGATTGAVVVTVGGQASNGVAFTLTVPPNITTVAPASGAVGTVVTITGTTFGATQGTSTVRFNGTTATPTSWSATSIVVPVPSGATTGDVVVTVGGQASNGVAFTVAPSITTLTPTAGGVGAVVTITGLNFGTTQETSTVSFNGTAATPTSWSATSLAVPVPSGATTGAVVVTVGGQASNGVAFSVTPPPSITTLAPAAGAVGTAVTITGTTFGATQGTSTVRFNGTTATPTSWSATSIVVPVPSGATTGDVVVTVGGQASNGVAFTVAPSITTVAPSSGLAGTAVTVMGLNFETTQGTSTVTFNGTTATPTTWSATSIAVPVPVGATTGAVVVTVGGVASNGVNFTVTPGGPSITSLSPMSGVVGTAVTIAGAAFGATPTPTTLAIGANLSANASTPSTTVTRAGVSTASGNQLLLALISAGWSAGPNTTVTGVAGGELTWVLVVRTNVQSGTSEIWRAFATTPLTNVSITATLSQSVRSSMRVMSFSGVDRTGTNGSGAIGAIGSGNANPGAPTATLTTTRNNSAVVGVGVDTDSSTARTLGASQTLLHQYLASASSDTYWVQGRTAPIPVRGTAVTINDVAPTGDRYNLSICEIVPAIGNGTAVTFNGTSATPTSWSATSIVVPVPTGATTGDVMVTVGGLGSNGSSFGVTVPPSITTVAPASGVVGTLATITGANFGATQGTSTVTFNGMSATPTSWSPTSIVVPVPSATSGPVVVTVGALASNGVTFTVTVPPSITSLSPPAAGVGAVVTITGLNFGTTQGSSSVTFNGTAATPTTWSMTSITAPVPAAATTGNVVVTVGGLSSNGVAFTVTPPPSITTLSPTAGAVGTAVTITGADFGATQGTSTVTFNGTIATPTSWSATSIVVPVPSGATTGNVVVTVGGLASNGVAFTAAPSITTLAPSAGVVGTAVTVTGLNFETTQGTSTVTFNGTAATPTSWSATSIVVPVPTGATTGPVVVTVGGQASAGVTFTVTLPPSITTVAPASGAVGTVVTITGTSFEATQGTSTVRFNGTTATPTSWSATSIVAPVPAETTTGPVVVTVGGQASNGVTFTVPPTITTLSPAVGPVGTIVTITGANFGATQGTSTVRFNTTTATPTNWSATSIVVPVPTGTTTGLVVVTVGGLASNSVTFTIGVLHTITSLSPTSGTIGVPVTITGTNFGATQGTKTVRFNGTLATPTSWSATSIVAPVPTGATTGMVVVTIAGLASNGVAFTVTPAPNITSRSPASGAAGTVVTITGTNFGATKGISTVRFNGLLATPTTWSGTSIVVPVPNGATTGNIVVTVGTQASNGVSFTVPAPTITSLSPAATSIGSSVLINGTNFGAAQGTSKVRFNGTEATTTNWTQTSVRVVVPSGATTGPVVVTASGGQVSNGVTFTVTAATAPTITSLSPTSGTVGTAVTISGSNLASEMLTGKIGWWGPFQSGVAPNNKMSGMPNGVFVGSPTFTGDGGGAITSTASNYLRIPDGASTFEWTSGTWSAQVDFAFPTTPVWGGTDHFLLVSNGSFNQGTGWEIQINNQVFNGKYQIQLESNHGVNGYHLISSYAIVPGGFHRALFICNTSGTGTWYVNGNADIQQPCAPSFAGGTDLFIGRYSDTPDHASNFPIARVQIWNRALTPAEAALSTTTDPTPSTVTFNGTAAAPTSWSPTSIVAPVPSGATTGNVVVTAGGQASNGVAFTVAGGGEGMSQSFGGESVGTFGLSGTVSPSSGGAGTTVSLGGTDTASTTADSSGNYSFPGVTSGTYSVMPNKAGYAFTPGSRVVTVHGADITGVNFTADVAYTISGTITPATAGAGSTVALSGTGQTTTADSSGTYVFTGLASGSYTVTPSKSGYAFTPGGQTVTVTSADVTANFNAAMGPTTDRANSYDNSWKTAWVAHARSLLTTSGKTDGFVLEIGDSLTHSAAYGTWPRQGQGQTAADVQAITWARGTSWGADNVDVTIKNGWYLAAADTTTQRGMTSSSGLSTGELVFGCCNGGPVMAATTDPVTAQQLLTDATVSANIQIDTLVSAFSDAQFAVVLLGTNDPTNPGNVAELTAIVDKLEAQHIVPILTTIPPRNDGGSNSLTVQFNAAITALAQARSLPLIDFYQEILLRRPGGSWFGTLISADGVHPTASGAGFTTLSNPYVPGGDAVSSTTGDAVLNVGYLLRSWLTVQKLKEVKQYVIDAINPPF